MHGTVLALVYACTTVHINVYFNSLTTILFPSWRSVGGGCIPHGKYEIRYSWTVKFDVLWKKMYGENVNSLFSWQSHYNYLEVHNTQLIYNNISEKSNWNIIHVDIKVWSICFFRVFPYNLLKISHIAYFQVIMHMISYLSCFLRLADQQER